MMRSIPWRPKLTAFGAHLLISVVVFTVIIAFTVGLWYPPPFFWIDGGVQITLLAAAVDIVAGPLLTLIVYRPKKPHLVMNLAVIAAIQFGALAWGVRVLYEQQPVLMAFIGYNQNRFFPITAEQAGGGARSIDELRALSPARPPMVYIDLPEDQEETKSLLASSTTSVLRHTERFSAIDAERLARIARGARTRKVYEAISPAYVQGIDRFVAEHGGNADQYAFIPLYGRFGAALLAISTTDGRLAGVVAKQMRLR
jgi:hypothetical protein